MVVRLTLIHLLLQLLFDQRCFLPEDTKPKFIFYECSSVIRNKQPRSIGNDEFNQDNNHTIPPQVSSKQPPYPIYVICAGIVK
jgi:hypothetical protein